MQLERPRAKLTLRAVKTHKQGSLLCKNEIPGTGRRWDTSLWQKHSLLGSLTSGCCPAEPCGLPSPRSNRKEYLPSGSRNELLQLLPCQLDGRKKDKHLVLRERSPCGQCCFGGPQAHRKTQTPPPHHFSLSMQTLIPPFSLFFVCFP